MNKVIGNNIKRLRLQKEMTQSEVAEKICLSQSAYARIERGESNSWANYLDSLCKTFEVSPEDLVKQENVVISSYQQGGNSNNSLVLYQNISEKLIEQYESRIIFLEKEIEFLRSQFKK